MAVQCLQSVTVRITLILRKQFKKSADNSVNSWQTLIFRVVGIYFGSQTFAISLLFSPLSVRPLSFTLSAPSPKPSSVFMSLNNTPPSSFMSWRILSNKHGEITPLKLRLASYPSLFPWKQPEKEQCSFFQPSGAELGNGKKFSTRIVVCKSFPEKHWETPGNRQRDLTGLIFC